MYVRCFASSPECLLTTYTPNMYFQVEVYSHALDKIILIHFEIKNQTNLLSEFDKIFVKWYALGPFEDSIQPIPKKWVMYTCKYKRISTIKFITNVKLKRYSL